MRVPALISLLAALLATACNTPAPARPATDSQRILILVTVDTLRKDHVGAHWGDVPLTPALDVLAKDSIVYDDVISDASETVPAHASMLTGLRPFRHRALSNEDPLPARIPSVAEALRADGFETGAIVSSLPLLRARLQRGFSTFNSRFDGVGQEAIKTPGKTTRVALNFLQAHAGQSFFLWVHYFPPHGPYRPAPAFLDGLEKRSSSVRLKVGDWIFAKGGIPSYQNTPGENDPEAFKRRYAGNVRVADHEVGVLLDWLRSNGLYDKAAIVVTADHGESLGEHDWYFCHANLVTDEQTRVPLLIKRPHGQGRGTRVGAPAESADIAPTLRRLAGLPDVADIDGRVILPEVATAAPRVRFTQSHTGELGAVRTDRFKLVARFPRELSYLDAAYPALQLFDLVKDPGETRDLSEREPALTRKLSQLLEANHAVSYRPDTGEDVAPPVPPEQAEALRALGYVN